MRKIVISGVPFVFEDNDLEDEQPKTGEFITIRLKGNNKTHYIKTESIKPLALAEGGTATSVRPLSRKKGRKLMGLNTPVADDVRFSARN